MKHDPLERLLEAAPLLRGAPPSAEEIATAAAAGRARHAERLLDRRRRRLWSTTALVGVAVVAGLLQWLGAGSPREGDAALADDLRDAASVLALRAEADPSDPYEPLSPAMLFVDETEEKTP